MDSERLAVVYAILRQQMTSKVATDTLEELVAEHNLERRGRLYAERKLGRVHIVLSAPPPTRSTQDNEQG